MNLNISDHKVSLTFKYDQIVTLKKVLFKENLRNKYFKSKMLSCTKKPFFFLFSSAVLSKSWRLQYLKTLWNYTMTKDFEEEIFMWTKTMLFYCPPPTKKKIIIIKIAFYSIFRHRPLSTIKRRRKKHHFKWHSPLERYKEDNLLSLVLGWQHVLIYVVDFFLYFSRPLNEFINSSTSIFSMFFFSNKFILLPFTDVHVRIFWHSYSDTS